MASALPMEFATLSFADLRDMMKCSERTVRRKLRERGITGGIAGRIPIDVLRQRWPELFNSFLITKDPRIACPDCGGPTMRQCLDGDCGFSQP
jgi:hypothetical protein